MYVVGIVLSGLGWLRPYDDDELSYVRLTLMWKGLCNGLGGVCKIN